MRLSNHEIYLSAINARNRDREIEEDQFGITRKTELREIMAKYLHSETASGSLDQESLSVFVSCSASFKVGKAREPIYEFVKGIVERRYQFKVSTGGPDKSQSLNIIEDARKKIENSTLFLCVMTPDLSSRSDVESVESAPSPWIPFEIGMAIALKKPIGLIISDAVSDEFYDRFLRSVQYQVTPIDIDLEPEVRKIIDMTLRHYFDAEYRT
ncbi:hypothetical protein N9L47_07220 [Rhodobacteraceae bacterium]|nr:hypothetical protein [Paracoccaceae bacterium]